MKQLKKVKMALAITATLLFLIVGAIQGFRKELIEPYSLWVGAGILLVGLAVGFLNVNKQEYQTFGIGCLILAVIGLGGILGIVPETWGEVGYMLKAWAGYLLVMSGSAGVAVAFKALFLTAKD